MCQLIFAKGVMPPTAHLETSWDNNPDGGGVMIQQPDKPATIYRTMSKEHFMAYCKGVKPTADMNIILHFRLRSHGDIDIRNVHPFYIYERDAYLFHNGCVSIDAPKGRSDTYAVARMLGEAGISTATLKVLGKLETSSRFIVAEGFGNKVWGINTKLGEWNDDATIWYSNSSHKYAKVRHTAPSYSSYQSFNTREWKGTTYASTYGRAYDDDYGYSWSKSVPKAEAKPETDELFSDMCCWCGQLIDGNVVDKPEGSFCEECWMDYQLEMDYAKDLPEEERKLLLATY